MVQFKYYLVLQLVLLGQFNGLTEGQGIGVNYGLQGDNLPPPEKVIPFCKSKNITRIRIFSPNQKVQTAIQNSGIELILGTENQDLKPLADDPTFAAKWVESHVKPYSNTTKFRCISAGNEVILGPLASFVLPALQNLKKALESASLGHIPVTTCVFLTVVEHSFPPSNSTFSYESVSIMRPILKFLDQNKYPLLCNVYPSFAYANDQKTVRLDYTLFNTSDVVVKDNKLGYNNLFDAMVDSFYYALKGVGASNVDVVVSETGWPSAGDGKVYNIENAGLYNNKLISHVNSGKGTPLKPNRVIETYIFALFNENLKSAGVEQHWGLFNPDMTEVYPVNFSLSIKPSPAPAPSGSESSAPAPARSSSSAHGGSNSSWFFLGFWFLISAFLVAV